MLNEERRRHILEILNRDGRVLVVDLAKQFRTSQVTIRKDLDVLQAHGRIQRSHGGALPARESALEAVTTEADRFAANVLPIIREAQKAGAATLRDIAAALNARGVATARGGQWYAQSVANILERA